ncbi:MAG: hypothetical protein ACE5PT_01985 [Gemmatimonadales bacterium]
MSAKERAELAAPELSPAARREITQCIEQLRSNAQERVQQRRGESRVDAHPAKSTVSQALKSLVQHGFLERRAARYTMSDPLFGKWVQAR